MIAANCSIDTLLTEQDASRVTGLSQRTIQHFRATGAGPKYRKLGKAVRYTLKDVEAWIDSLALTRIPPRSSEGRQ